MKIMLSVMGIFIIVFIINTIILFKLEKTLDAPYRGYENSMIDQEVSKDQDGYKNKKEM